MHWEIDLSDGSTVVEDKANLSHWSNVIDHCHKNNLTISEFRVVGKSGKSKVIDKNADRYFVVNEILANLTGIIASKRGIGSVRESTCKVRTEWYDLDTSEFITVEVQKGLPDHIYEISLAHSPRS